MRVDIREETIRVAEAELRENGCYVTLVSKEIVESLGDDWSPLVQLMIATEGGIAEITVREVSNQESKP